MDAGSHLIPYQSLAVVRKIRGSRMVKWLPSDRIEGTHRPDGILAARGVGIGQGKQINAQIADCAPTLLAMMGQPVPDDMDGRVVNELFAELPIVSYEPAQQRGMQNAGMAHDAGEQPIYSAEQMQTLTKRLTDLGYLE